MQIQSLRFFGKPGCISNKKQIKLLKAAGVEVEHISLLDHPFEKEELRSFLSQYPRSQWTNASAPAIKAGEINPVALSESELLEHMLKSPLLIKRPLIVFQEKKLVGFGSDTINVIESIIGRRLDADGSVDQCSAKKSDLESQTQSKDSVYDCAAV